MSPTGDVTAFVGQRQYLHFSAGHLIGCDKKSEIVQYFLGRLCDKTGLLCDKICDFLGLIYIVLPGFEGEKPLQCCLTGNLNVKE